jgi:hypothetical protein
LKNTPNRRLLW